MTKSLIMAYRTNEFEDRFYDERRRPQSTYDDVRLAERERTSDRDRLDFLRSDPRPQESGPPSSASARSSPASSRARATARPAPSPPATMSSRWGW